MTEQVAGTRLLGGDLPINRLGLGSFRLTERGRRIRPSVVRALLQRAVELGIDLIDTADIYGSGDSERFIAESLRPYPEGLVIATKGGLLPDARRRDGSPKHLRRACEGSLRRLRLERIDLYQLHAPDPKVPIEESVAELAFLQAEGKIRHIGLCNVDLKQLSQARQVAAISAVQNRCSVTECDSIELVTECERRNLAFLSSCPLAEGALAQEKGPLAQFAARRGVSPGQLALAWLLRLSPVMVPIPGTTSLASLEENVAAASLSLTDAEFEELFDLGRRVQAPSSGAGRGPFSSAIQRPRP